MIDSKNGDYAATQTQRTQRQQRAWRLDDLITADDRAPVVVEAEYEAVGTADALGRPGLSADGETHPIAVAIALRGFALKGTLDAKPDSLCGGMMVVSVWL